MKINFDDPIIAEKVQAFRRAGLIDYDQKLKEILNAIGCKDDSELVGFCSGLICKSGKQCAKAQFILYLGELDEKEGK
jgi:hypothetical protein